MICQEKGEPSDYICLESIILLLTLGAHAQRGLQYSVCLSVCLSVTTLQASVVDRTLKFRHQRSADDTLECFDSWILLKLFPSRDNKLWQTLLF